jgi:hypothetical protein
VLLSFKDRLLWRFLSFSFLILIGRAIVLVSLFFLGCGVHFKGFEVCGMVGFELFFSLFNHFNTGFVSIR